MDIGQIQIPDFAGTIQRGQALQQQSALSRLQLLSQQQAYDDAQAYRAAAGEVLPQLGTAEGERRMSLLAQLAGSGPQGAQVALPMLNSERERAEFQRMLGGVMPGGNAPGPSAPAGAPVMTSAPPQPPAAPAVDVRAVNQRFAALRQQVMDNPNLTPEAQQAALAQISAQHAAAIGGAREAPGGYRGDQPWAAGLPAPSGVVPTSAPAPAAPAPAGTSGLPSPQALFAMAASGNPRAIEFVRTVGPLVARESPNFAFQNIGGTLYAINPQNPTQRVAMGPAGDPDRTLVDVRQPDGSVQHVPRAQAAGMTSAPPAPPPADNFGRSNTLRDEFTKLTADYRIVRDAFSNIETAARSSTGAGDMSMLYSFVKLLDPSSVVRESEFASAAASGSFGERIQGAVQRVLSGERLPDSLRGAFLTEARNIYGTQQRQYRQTESTYRDLAQRNNLRPEDVVLPFAPAQAAPPPGALPQATVPGPNGGPAEPPVQTNIPPPPPGFTVIR